MPDAKTARAESGQVPTEKGPAHAPGHHDNGWRLELLALTGFCVSGVFFIMAGLKSGDLLTVLGSVVWIASCFCWMLPYRKHLIRRKKSPGAPLP
jgi:hypothetical protein